MTIYGGFQAVNNNSGAMPTGATQDFIVCAQSPSGGAAAVLNSFFSGDAVRQTTVQTAIAGGIAAGGLITVTSNASTIAASYVTGVVQGVKYFDAQGHYKTERYIPAGQLISQGVNLIPNQVSNASISLLNQGYFFLVTVNIAPSQVYEVFVQEVTPGAGGVYPGLLGSFLDIVTISGNKETGLSGMQAKAVTGTPTNPQNLPLRLLGLSNKAQNQFSADYQGNSNIAANGNFGLVQFIHSTMTDANWIVGLN